MKDGGYSRNDFHDNVLHLLDHGNVSVSSGDVELL